MRKTLSLIFSLVLSPVILAVTQIPNYEIEDPTLINNDFTIAVYIDSNNIKRIEDISKLDKQFKKTSSRYTINTTTHTYWFAYKLTNSTHEIVERIVGFDEVFLESVEIYYKEDSMWIFQQNGVSIPLSKRRIKNQCPSFEIRLNANESKIIYFKVKSLFALTTGASILSKNAFLKREQNRTIGYWSYLGGAFIMLIFSVSLFLYFRERIYLYYVLDILCFSIFLLLYSGFFLYISSNLKLYYSFHASISMVGVFIALFAIKLLGFKEYVKWIHYSLVGIATTYLILAVLITIDIFYYQFMVAFALPSMAFLLFAGIYSLSKKSYLAKFYILGLGAYQLGFFIIAIFNLGVLPFNFITRYGYILGAFIQMIMFFVALSFRLKYLQKEKGEIQEKLLLYERSKKEELEKQVIARTKELEETNKYLSRLSKFKDDMTGMIVHDLKNPLNAIIDILPADKTNPIFRTIEQSSFTMMNLIRNILDVYKADSDQLKLNKTQHLITSITQTAYQDVLYLAQQKGIDFEFKGHLSCVVKADRDILVRVLTNLFTNAIKASPTQKKISVEFRYDHECIVVSISNRGKSIPEKLKYEIFEKFKQFDHSESKRSSNGLGLAFCKLAVEAHDGKIGVSSDNQTGVTFWFSLPHVLYSDTELIENIPIPPEKLDLSTHEKAYLAPFIAELIQTDIYDIWTINKIISTIKPHSSKIQKWLNKLDDAIYTSNNDLYKKLLVIEENE